MRLGNRKRNSRGRCRRDGERWPPSSDKKGPHEVETIASFPEERLNYFRETRNRITHRGFSPKDDSESTSLYLEIGLPFLEATYRDLHSYELSDGLLREYVELLDGAREVHRRAKALSGCDLSYCLNAFGHLIRWCFKHNFSTAWEITALVHTDESGQKFEKAEKEKRELERLFGAIWFFDCPICDDVQSVVCELDEAELDSRNIAPKRMACTACGFVVGESQPFLSEVLLQKQIAEVRTQILKEYGLVE